MAPRYLINKRQGTIWPYTADLATNTDLEPYYGEEPKEEAAVAGAEVAEEVPATIAAPVAEEAPPVAANRPKAVAGQKGFKKVKV